MGTPRPNEQVEKFPKRQVADAYDPGRICTNPDGTVEPKAVRWIESSCQVLVYQTISFRQKYSRRPTAKERKIYWLSGNK